MQGHSLLVSAAIAVAAIAGRRFVIHSAKDGECDPASDGDTPFWGVSSTQGAAAGAVCDITTVGEAILELGGEVSAGDDLTSDANGKGIVAEPAAGEIIQVGARAEQSGVAGDFIRVTVNRYRLATPQEADEG